LPEAAAEHPLPGCVRLRRHLLPEAAAVRPLSGCVRLRRNLLPEAVSRSLPAARLAILSLSASGMLPSEVTLWAGETASVLTG
jgi:hypothetical protein